MLIDESEVDDVEICDEVSDAYSELDNNMK